MGGAVVNAVYHRGYDVREPVELRIARDELVVLSYPGPDRSVRKNGRRRPNSVSTNTTGISWCELPLICGICATRCRSRSCEAEDRMFRVQRPPVR